MKTPSERLGDLLREFQELILDTRDMFPSREYPAFTEAFTHYQRTLPRNRLEERKRLGLPPLPSRAHEYSQTPSAVAARYYREKAGTEPRFVTVEELIAAQPAQSNQPDQALIDRLAQEAKEERIKLEQQENPVSTMLEKGDSLV
jgi:hypothetical protein